MSLRNLHAVTIVRGHITHRGEWFESQGRVHLESAYGAAEARLGQAQPRDVAAALLARLVETTGGRRSL